MSAGSPRSPPSCASYSAPNSRTRMAPGRRSTSVRPITNAMPAVSWLPDSFMRIRPPRGLLRAVDGQERAPSAGNGRRAGNLRAARPGARAADGAESPGEAPPVGAELDVQDPLPLPLPLPWQERWSASNCSPGDSWLGRICRRALSCASTSIPESLAGPPEKIRGICRYGVRSRPARCSCGLLTGYTKGCTRPVTARPARRVRH